MLTSLIDEIESELEGLRPSIRDIVRLNALGLKYDAASGRDAFRHYDHLSRAVLIEDGFYLREPAIGHEIFLETLERNFGPFDRDTELSLKAFAFSREVDALPDAFDFKAVKKALSAFEKKVAKFSRQQIFAAAEFVISGFDETAYEAPARPKGAAETPDEIDLDECLALGTLSRGRVFLWGLSAAELKRMRRREVEELIRDSHVLHGLEVSSVEERANMARGEFYRTLDSIKERLIKEQGNGQQ